MIPIKTAADLEKMSHAGLALARIMEELSFLTRPGIATGELDKAAAQLMVRLGVKSAFKGYRGYPANICVSVNEEVVHGIPGVRRFGEGDIVSIDLGIESGGFFVDMAKTFPVGSISREKMRLLEITEGALGEAVALLKPGLRLSDVSCAIQRYVEARGFSVVRDFVGHGIGRGLHEEPQIPNFGPPGEGPVLEAGMVLALEPMVNAGRWEIDILEDGWTAVTRDRKPSAHFEHTVAIGAAGVKILTR